jgi:hypothetical protein
MLKENNEKPNADSSIDTRSVMSRRDFLIAGQRIKILLGANSKENWFSFDEGRHKIYEINI